MTLLTWLSNHESSIPCRLHSGEGPKKIKDIEAQEEKQTVVCKEQYKATMVDQELDEAKVVEGEWHAKSKAPYHH